MLPCMVRHHDLGQTYQNTDIPYTPAETDSGDTSAHYGHRVDQIKRLASIYNNMSANYCIEFTNLLHSEKLALMAHVRVPTTTN